MKVWWFNTVVGIRCCPRGTKARWGNPWSFFSITPESKREKLESVLVLKCWWFKTVVEIRDGPRGAKSHWVDPW